MSEAMRFGSGQTVRRIEDPALVQGQGCFTDDVAPAGQLHLCFVRSSAAHARILAIDADAARSTPGVVAVFTGAELVAAGVKPLPLAVAFRRPDGAPAAAPPRPALAHEVVRFVGEPVAAVVATSRAAAQAAAAMVFVELDERPAVADPWRATEPGAPRVCDAAPDNIAAVAQHGEVAAAAAAFECAAHVVALDIENQRLAPGPIEPRTVLAAFDATSGRLTVRLSSQMPSAVRNGLAELIPGLSKETVRVQVGDVGGGFGMKTGLYAEDVVVAYAALQLKAAVKWRPERLEDFLSAVHGRDVHGRAELALDAQGRVLALRLRARANVGAYPTAVGIAIQLLIGPWVSTSVYDIPTIDLHYTAVLTHTAPTGPYRGAGRPEAIYIIERLMDEAARTLALDPAELRRRNLIGSQQMPYRNAMGQVYDCGNFESILDQALARADWAGFDLRAAASAARGRLRGRGIVTFLEWTGGNALEENATVDVLPDGTIEIFTATQAMGQGIATSYAQLAVDIFDVPLERIRIVQGDTDRGNGFGSAGSRSLFTAGTAVREVAQRTVEHSRDLAAQALEAPAADLEYRGGRFSVAGTDLGIGLGELAARQAGRRIVMQATTTVAGPSWPNGCHICEVEVDAATGAVEIVAYVSVNDIGRVISPAIVRGQVEGGAVQGIGQALCERLVHDDSAQLLSASFMDYALPRVDGFRAFDTSFDTSTPCTNNPLGAKGVGELGTIGATPVVVGAVIDALIRAGAGARASALQMPLLPERVWRALRVT